MKYPIINRIIYILYNITCLRYIKIPSNVVRNYTTLTLTQMIVDNQGQTGPLPGGPVGLPARWSATSNVEEGNGREERAGGT